MNKTLLTIALLASSVAAQAGTLMTVQNQAGGLIHFNDNKSAYCAEKEGERYQYHVLATRDDGGYTVGCWKYDTDNETVSIHWHSGKTSVFELDAVTFTDYGKTKLGLKK